MFHATHRILAPAAAVIALVTGLYGGALADDARSNPMRGGSGIHQLVSADFEGSGGRFSFVSASAQPEAQAAGASAQPVETAQTRPRDDSFGGFLNSLAGDAVWAIETVLADWR